VFSVLVTETSIRCVILVGWFWLFFSAFCQRWLQKHSIFFFPPHPPNFNSRPSVVDMYSKLKDFKVVVVKLLFDEVESTKKSKQMLGYLVRTS